MRRQIRDLKSRTYSDIEDRLEYNSKINEYPIELEDAYLFGEKGILVKLFRFTEHTTTKGGLINVRFSERATDGGRKMPKIDDFKYQARGVIHRITPEAKAYIEENFSEETAKKFQVGATVWIHPEHGMNPRSQFLYSRIHPVVDDPDFLMLHPNHVDAIENNDLYTLKAVKNEPTQIENSSDEADEEGSSTSDSDIANA
jgi:hypothetical protein